MTEKLGISIRNYDFRKAMKFNYISKGKFWYVVSSILWRGMKRIILLKRSTTTKIESKPRWILCYHKTKSILRYFHGAQATSRGVYEE